MKSFKICTCCSKVYVSRDDLIRQCDYIGEWGEFGLTLYNCECKTTLSIETFEGSRAIAAAKLKKNHNSKDVTCH